MNSSVLAGQQLHTIGSPWLWAATIAGVLVLLALDFVGAGTGSASGGRAGNVGTASADPSVATTVSVRAIGARSGEAGRQPSGSVTIVTTHAGPHARMEGL